MQPVKLFTRDGGFVVAGFVPPFMAGHEADVIVWGIRVFTLDTLRDGEPKIDANGALIYSECFAVALVEENPPRLPMRAEESD